MHRLMIVDDEADIVDSLCMYLQDTKPELDIYRAYSAREAIEWLNRTKMDIVLTDIRMPGMSGIQLLDNIRHNWPSCKVIFVTGYDEFEYAHTALKYGSVDFILKSEGYEEIEKAVEKAVAEIENTMLMHEWIDTAKKHMEAMNPLLQAEYLQGILQGESYSNEDRVEHFRQIELPLHADRPVMLLIAHPENIPKTISLMERSRLIYAVKTVVEQHLSATVIKVGIIGERSNLIWFIQPIESAPFGQADESTIVAWERTALFVKGTAETIQHACLRTLNVSVSFITDSRQSPWEAVADRYDSLKLLLHRQLGHGTNMRIIDRSETASDWEPGLFDERYHQHTRLRLKQLHNLEAYLESGARQECFDLLAEITAFFQEVQDKHHAAALTTYYSVSLIFMAYIDRWHLAKTITDGNIDLNILTRVDEHRSWQEASAYFAKLAELIFDLRFHEEENRAFKTIGTVKQFILDHYGEDLSLVRLAQLVHFNPSYLSRLFKQVAGTNLLSYINEVRIEHAKRLLRESDLKIHEISRKVGYMSAPYFTRFFKRSVHMSPQEYRDSASVRPR